MEHLALDEVLLDAVAAGRRGPCLRFWRWTERALVVGSHQSLRNEVDFEACASLGFAVVRRMSGGGTMVCEPGGTLTYSLYLPEALVRGLSFVDSFRELDAWAVAELVELGVPASYRPINDIVSPAGKIAGAAQARRRGAVLHHTTMAYAIDPGIVPRLIRIGRPTLEARGPRSAEKMVTPLTMFTSLPLEEVEAALARGAGGPSDELSRSELDAARELAASKYATPEWVHRFP
ncbi:MAG TPA: biotin/lipoate A/B protein ligase family protein [Candidatus Dormibacteraeota bacterium]